MPAAVDNGLKRWNAARKYAISFAFSFDAIPFYCRVSQSTSAFLLALRWRDRHLFSRLCNFLFYHHNHNHFCQFIWILFVVQLNCAFRLLVWRVSWHCSTQADLLFNINDWSVSHVQEMGAAVDNKNCSCHPWGCRVAKIQNCVGYEVWGLGIATVLWSLGS